MIERLTALVLVGSLLSVPGIAAEPDDIVGSWVSSGGSGHIEISQEGDEFVGHIVAVFDPVYWPGEFEGRDGQPRLDHNNPDKSLQTRPLKGLRILEGFRFDGEKWIGGTVYDPTRGSRYKGEMRLLGDGRLKLRGYFKFKWVGRSTLWLPLADYRERIEALLGPDGE